MSQEDLFYELMALTKAWIRLDMVLDLIEEAANNMGKDEDKKQSLLAAVNVWQHEVYHRLRAVEREIENAGTE